MDYLVDTDICVYIVRRKSPIVRERMLALPSGAAGMSVVTFFELVHGAMKSNRPAENLGRAEELVRVIPVLSLDADVALVYGRLRTELERAGTIIGSYDMLIAAHAVALGLTLVTNNTREFSRVKGLRVENWTR